MAHRINKFEARRGLRNAHLQTVAGNFWPRPRFALPFEAREVVVDAVDGSRVLCHCSWQRDGAGSVRRERLAVVLVHGLEVSSDSRYIRGIAARLWAAGMHVVRMNQRNCGGSERLTPRLYNSALSADVGAVVDWVAATSGVERVALVGYSMGGNLVLKHAGEREPGGALVAVATVSAAIDLAVSSRALHMGLNRLYERWFLRGLMARYRRKADLFPGVYARDVGPVRSLWEFDEKIVARHCGYRSAEDYYARAGASSVVGAVRVPTLYLHSMDDPFIKLTDGTLAALASNPAIDLHLLERGGHCAFLSRARGEDVHWAEMTVAGWLKEFC